MDRPESLLTFLAILFCGVSYLNVLCIDPSCVMHLDILVDKKMKSLPIDGSAEWFTNAEFVREFCLLNRLTKGDCRKILHHAETGHKNLTCSQNHVDHVGENDVCKCIRVYDGVETEDTHAPGHGIFVYFDYADTQRYLSDSVPIRGNLKWLVERILIPRYTGSPIVFVGQTEPGPMTKKTVSCISNGVPELSSTVRDQMRDGVAIVFKDASTNLLSVVSYLRKAERALEEITQLKSWSKTVGLLVWNDFDGLFPTSIYEYADFVLRHHYFPDQMVYPHVHWLPLGANRMAGRNTSVIGRPRAIFVAAFIDPHLFSCERGPAEVSSGEIYQARCFADWRVKDLLRNLRLLDKKLAKSSGSSPTIQIYEDYEELSQDLDSIMFLAALPAEGTLGSESRAMYDCLERGCVPIIQGPTKKLGLYPLGPHSPILEIKSSDWSSLSSLVDPYVNNETDQLHLRTSAFNWWNSFLEQHVRMLTRADQNALRRRARSSPGILPFQRLLRSYDAWGKYHASASHEREYLMLLINEAHEANRAGLSPPPLRVYAYENIAAAHQETSTFLRAAGLHGFQRENRKALRAISESLRILLGDYTSERCLFPSFPKLVAVAAALAWDLWAPHAGEWLTRQALSANPFSAAMLEQLIGILLEVDMDLKSTAVKQEISELRSRLAWVQENTYTPGVWIAAPNATGWHWWRGGDIGWPQPGKIDGVLGSAVSGVAGSMKSMQAIDAVDELLELMGMEDSSVYLFLLESEPLLSL